MSASPRDMETAELIKEFIEELTWHSDVDDDEEEQWHARRLIRIEQEINWRIPRPEW